MPNQFSMSLFEILFNFTVLFHLMQYLVHRVCSLKYITVIPTETIQNGRHLHNHDLLPLAVIPNCAVQLLSFLNTENRMPTAYHIIKIINIRTVVICPFILITRCVFLISPICCWSFIKHLYCFRERKKGITINKTA
jgi:hypothetical protein